MIVFNVSAPYSKSDLIVNWTIFDAQILSSCFLAVSWLHITICATLSVHYTLGRRKTYLFRWAHHQLWLVIWQWYWFVSANDVARWVFMSCIWLILWERRVRSFANWSLSFERSVHWIPRFYFFNVTKSICKYLPSERAIISS